MDAGMSDSIEFQPQLYSREAEEILVGHVLKWPEDLATVNIQPDDFYLQRTHWIWDAIKALSAKGQAVDSFTVANELKSAGRDCPDDYIWQTLDRVPFGHAPESTAAIVRGYARRRAQLRLAGDMAKDAYDLQADLDQRAGVYIDALTRNAAATGAVHYGKFLSQLYDEVEERRKNPQDAWGIETGIAAFDRATGGLQPDELFILSGRPGIGKTMLSTQICEQLAHSEPGVIYSAEMTAVALARRMVSKESGVRAQQLKTGHIDADEWDAFVQAIARLSQLPIYMSDSAAWTTVSLRADLARLKALHGVKWFFFDYLMLLQDGEGLNETERTAMISRAFKTQLCRGLSLAGVLVHSMNKAGSAAGMPGQESLRGSGQVSYDADVIGFLTEFIPMGNGEEFIPQAEKENMRTFTFGKGRELEQDRRYFHLVKRSGYPVFADYAAEPTPAQRVGKNGRKS